MKKQFSLRSLTLSLIAISLLAIIVIITTTSSKAESPLAVRLSGRILLQVEDNGQAWYVSADNNNQRIYLGSPQQAFNLMRTLGLGISNNDLNRYLNDNDNKFPTRLSGKILLAVEQHGEAYYINPVNLRGYYLGRPLDAFNLMRELALGITNTDLDAIEVFEQEEIDSQQPTTPIEESITNISLTTNPVAPMTNFSHIISVSATITNPDNISIKERGLLYDFTVSPNTNLTPTLEKYNQKLISEISSQDNTYTINISNLTPGSYPFIRSYVITSDNQIIYGNTITISSINNAYLPYIPNSSSTATPSTPPTPTWACGDPITDERDSNVYNTVEIGDQCWFAENLAYLPEIHDNDEFVARAAAASPGYGVYGYDGSDVTTAKAQDNYSDYGVLYNGYSVNQITLCPAGWHVPSLGEFVEAANYIGDETPGYKMKASSINPINWGDDSTDIYGFTLLPAGMRSGKFGTFEEIGAYSNIWSSSSYSDGFLVGSEFQAEGEDIKIGEFNKPNGYSVRCLKDAPKILTYVASEGGSINTIGIGTTTQIVNYSEDGEAVTAIPDEGYYFLRWSDGSIQNPRTDKNVIDNLNVEAEFEAEFEYGLIKNGGFEVVAEILDNNWSLQGLLHSDFEQGNMENNSLQHSPIRSSDAYDGSSAIEFKGSSDGYSLLVSDQESLILASGTSYTLRLYAKGIIPVELSGVLFFNSEMELWNFNNHEWSSEWMGVENPFVTGSSYLYELTTLTDDYTEFVLPSIVGSNKEVIIAISSMSEGLLVDNFTFSENDDGINLLNNPSFEDNWVNFPAYWTTYIEDSATSNIEIINDTENVYSGDYSLYFNGASYLELRQGINNGEVARILDLNFYAKSPSGSVLNIFIQSEDNRFYNFSTNLFQEAFTQTSIGLRSSFALKSVPGIAIPEDIGYFRIIFSANGVYIDDISLIPQL